ncbi:hypothetical protein J3F83DRAFT_537169 [Trichoderma novae-zelandiae]
MSMDSLLLPCRHVVCSTYPGTGQEAVSAASLFISAKQTDPSLRHMPHLNISKAQQGTAKHSASRRLFRPSHTHALTAEFTPHPPATGRQTLSTSDCSDSSSYYPPMLGASGEVNSNQKKESSQSPSTGQPWLNYPSSITLTHFQQPAAA